MAWEKRETRSYYYRVKPENGRLQKQCFGSGPEAQQAAARDEAARTARRQEQAVVRSFKESVAPALSQMRELEEGCRLLMRGTLLAAGFHQHKGNWRKRRG